MTVTAVLNQKGGVGKTTVALNLAHTWAAAGLRVLVVDCDKQAAATSSLLVDDLALDDTTIADVLRAPDRGADLGVVDAIRRADTQWGPVDVVPASLDLEDVWSSAKPGLVFRLRRALDVGDVHDHYDRVLLDGPPDLGPATVAAVVASDGVVIPTRPERMALHGVARTVETVHVVRRDMRPDVDLVGIVPVAVDRRVGEHVARVDEVRRLYGGDVTDTTIPHRLKSDEASGAGEPAAHLPGPAGSALAAAYADLADEVDKRTGNYDDGEQR